MARGSAPVRHGAHETTHPFLRVLGLVVAAALGFAIVFAQQLTGSVAASIETADVSELVSSTPEPPPAQSGGEPLNILLMGSDQRDGNNRDIGGSDAGGMRNDTTIIAHVSGDRSRIDLVSIPRDLQVAVPDCELFDGTVVRGWTGDFNVAFFNGGQHGNPAEAAACVINTIHDTFDIRIDHYAVVDFTGFIDMIDALGGVPMCVPERIVSSKARLDLQPGLQTLDGETALAFARLRTAEVGDVSGSDLQRIARQQDLLEQTARQALSKNLLTDAVALTSFVRAGAESLTTDEDLGSVPFMVGLAVSMRGLRGDDLTFATVPWRYTEDFLNVEMTDDAEVMFDDLRNDRPLSVRAEGDASSRWDDGTVDADEANTGDGEPSGTDDEQDTPSAAGEGGPSEAADEAADAGVAADPVAQCGV